MYSLLPYNTFGIDVSANRFIEYASVEELKTLIEQGAVTTPFLHIGGGSNLLFTKDYEGVVLHSRIEGIEVAEDDERSVSVRVGAGVGGDDFVAYCVEHGWYGAEECCYAYRNSIFKRPENKSVFVTHVCFRLSKEEHYMLDYGTIRQELEKYPALTLPVVRKIIIDIREAKLPDPKVMGNAGSFFMNPIVPREKLEALQQEYPGMPYYELPEGRVKIPAGWMIDQCGWKGQALGPAAVHDKQALVLVNCGGAKGSDIIALSDAVRASVREKFGIDIHPEVNFV